MSNTSTMPEMETGTVLVLDDEALIALDLAASVEESGRTVIGPAHNLDQAFELIEDVTPEAALLDINIGRKQVWPLARALRARGTRLVFISGDLSEGNLQAEFRDAPQIHKPAMPDHIQNALAQEPQRRSA